jgi:hypothetical protein
MQHVVTMTKLQPSQTHGHPALDVGHLENQALVLDHRLEIGVKVFKDEIQVSLTQEHVKELASRRCDASAEREVRTKRKKHDPRR